jgi:hypothetical protein
VYLDFGLLVKVPQQASLVSGKKYVQHPPSLAMDVHLSPGSVYRLYIQGPALPNECVQKESGCHVSCSNRGREAGVCTYAELQGQNRQNTAIWCVCVIVAAAAGNDGCLAALVPGQLACPGR